MEKEIDNIRGMLSDDKVRNFVVTNLKNSLKSIGYSEELVDDLISFLDNLDIGGFQKANKEELKKIHTIGFFRKIVPAYFIEHVIPHIPSSEKILDIGCGTGILASKLAESGKFKKIMAIDINEYPEWNLFASEKTSFYVVKQEEFDDFFIKNKPNTVVLTWTLHHMEYEEQKEYLSKMYEAVDRLVVVALEDSYSEKLQPRKDIGVYAEFMDLTKEERKNFMSICDWIANRVLEMRDKIPIPFAYMTLEEWEKLFQDVGYNVKSKRFIGFPDKRDINTPQSLIVAEK
jgi:SAM-dependent methyltransferase